MEMYDIRSSCFALELRIMWEVILPLRREEGVKFSVSMGKNLL